MKRPTRLPTRPLILGMGIVLLAACAAHQEDIRDPQVTGVIQPPEALPTDEVRVAEGDALAVLPAGPVAQVDQGAHVRNRSLEQSRRSEAAPSAAKAILGLRAPFAPPCCYGPPQPEDAERYATLDDNPVHRVAEQPVSTFSIDVDTGAYANVRRFLTQGQLPPEDAVRVEEMLNYFDYSYPAPGTRSTPFRVSTELARTPWNPDSMLLKVGIKGFEVPAGERPAANLVFLIDVSGSMQSPDKLPLLKNAFRLLTQQLSHRDRVSMVVYAGASGVVLEPTAGDHKQRILDALGQLEAGGSTNGADGIRLAYRLARDARIKGGINRVILATDGDFNVGTTNFESLIDLAEHERTTGVALTTLGFGTGNYNEKLMEQLADAGNGNYAYIDNLSEARKVLVEEVSSTLMTIARDVKIQVEFNPALVAEYRLIGYENRILAREDFNNDKVDAGDIGAGHRVTALYEVVPVGKQGRIDPLRYSRERDDLGGPVPYAGELAFVRLRYKAPQVGAGNDESKLIQFPVLASSRVAAGRESSDFRFAASVAAFGQKLRGGKYLGSFDYDDIRALAKPTLNSDAAGHRREFLALVDLAQTLSPHTRVGLREHGRERFGRVEEGAVTE
ncbi:MAG: VWA domain-containing protein [Steroidobacteraceae bacterium]